MSNLFEVKYDDGGNQWSAFFATEAEAMDQAASDVHLYGGTPAHEILDNTGTPVADQAAITQAADALPD
jgi:hypothetical protein